jgi:transcriptional regulator with XRE-family HTH domain
MPDSADSRTTIRDFLISRRAKISPEQAGLPAGSRRRVPGLRREEVAVLAGVSTEWYTRLEKGHISGVSEDVLDAVARALHLDDEERTYLFDLAHAARPKTRRSPRRAEAKVEPHLQWLIDSITMSAAFLRNGRLDVVAGNALARALHEPMFSSPTTTANGRANFARYHFLDPASRNFFTDWEAGATATVALLRAEAGRHPEDRALRELVGELSTLSSEFRTMWASHDIRIRHEGIKRLQHPVVGAIALTYQALALPTPSRAVHELSIYTAEPATTNEERMKILATWSATTIAESARRPG